MNRHFDRTWRVTLARQSEKDLFGKPDYFGEVGNAVVITQLKIEFKIEKTSKPEPNKCELTITNLNEDMRALCQRRPLRVHLEGGYDGEPRLLFVGDVGPSPGSKHTKTEWETKLLIGDGLRAFANARAIPRSYKSGTTVHTILRDAAEALGLQLPREIDTNPFFKTTISTGDISMGYASDELTRHLAPYGYSWSIQNGQLVILRDEDARPDLERLISVETGMIESPSAGNPDKKGHPPKVSVKSLLYPELQPGGRVRIKSKTINGLHKIEEVKHEGDSSGGNWYTTVEVSPL